MTAGQTVRVGISTPEALLLLPLPEDLSGIQLEGRVCVFCGNGVTARTSIDLGSRILGARRIFPRACPGCISKEAITQLSLHCLGVNACQDCKEEPICDLGSALNRLIRMGAR